MDEIARLYSFSEEEKDCILQNFNRTTRSVGQDIRIIEEWFECQPHLPKLRLGDRRILSFLMMSKFCIEKTKGKIESYFYIRNALPEFFIGKDPTNQAVKESALHMCWTPLPTLIKGFSRVSICRLHHEDVLDIDPTLFVAHLLNMADCSLQLEYAFSQTAILDCNMVTMSHFAKVTTMLMRKGLAISEKVYKRKVAAVHLINCPPYIDTMIAVVKGVLKSKVSARIHVHETLDSLFDYVPQDILPKEYGGNEVSLAEINEKWYAALEEYSPWIKSVNDAKFDWNLRPEKLVSDEFLGLHGNFRKLDVD